MIVHILKFNAKAGKEKTVHKIIRKYLHQLREEEHTGMSYHSFRDAADKRHFIHIEIFETEEAVAKYQQSEELKSYVHRLSTVVDGVLDYHKVENFAFYQGRVMQE